MKSVTPCLQLSDIEALLAGTVPASQNELWEEHFSSCENCRMAMASQVGEPEWWREAEQSLMGESIPEVRDSVKNETDERASIDELLKLLGPTDDPQMLGRIGAYEVLGVLGRGGMGVVFKAFDAPLNRFVAIKMLLPHLAVSGAARKRFAREGQAVAAVVDDHVMAIHCVDEWQGVPYLVMTYSRGVSLQKRLSDHGPLDVREILRIGMQTAKGLAAAHAQGIVHRDIKPANIFLDQNVERVQLMDFGLARAVDDASLTRSGTLAGTPQYMSPEQARAETVDHRSDLFSLGSVLYAMCTGHAPFRAESSYGVLRLITDKEPRPIRGINPDVPEWLCAIIGQLMAKKAEARFASAEEVARLLECCLAHVQQPTANPIPESLRDLQPQSFIATPQFSADLLTTRLWLRVKQISQLQITRFIAVGLFAFSLIFAGVVMVRESNKGTSTIGSQADNVPLVPQQSLFSAVRAFNNLHSSDAQGKPKPPLDLEELIAVMKWKLGNDELSDEMVKALQPIVYTRDRMLPAGWRFVGGQIDEVCRHGVVHSWQIKLETKGLSKPLVIRRSPLALSRDQKAIEPPTSQEAMVSLKSLVEQFNATYHEVERRARLDHELQPLTTDEVLAALVWSGEEDASSGIRETIAKRLPQILATHHLPQGTKIELVPSIENAIGQRFYIERIQLLIPETDNPAKVDTLVIRNQFIGQDYNPIATYWSKPGENGLQVGMRFLPAADTYQKGQVVDIEFLYRSATSRRIPVTLPATFQFEKVEGIRLKRVSFLQPKWPDGTNHAVIGNKPLAVRGHRMQFCFESDEELEPGVNLRAMTRPEAHHYVRFTVENPGDDAQGEMLEIAERLDFGILPLTPPAVLPLYESHYYQHWGASVPNHRLPTESRPDPEYVDTFQIGVSLGPAEQHRIPVYYPSGLQITKVAPNSPAAAVGIEVGDIIMSWEGNHIYGDDPTKPFAHYSIPNTQLKDALEQYRKSEGWSNFNIDLDLLDHRTGEVIRIYPTFGKLANGGPNKAEILKRMAQRKQLRQGMGYRKAKPAVSNVPHVVDPGADTGINIDIPMVGPGWIRGKDNSGLLYFQYGFARDVSNNGKSDARKESGGTKQ